MITKKYTKLFRTALLNKDESRIAELEKEILASGATAEEIESEKLWAETAYPLVDEALELRAQGYFTESLKFDDLERRADKIGMPLPAYLRSLMQSAAMIELEAAQKKQTYSKPYTRYDSLNRTATFLLTEIRWKASWGKKGNSEVKALLKEIQERFPESVAQAQENIEIGRTICQAGNEARQLGLAGKSEDALEKLYEKLTEKIGQSISDYQRTKIREQYDIGIASRERDQMNNSNAA